MGRGKGRGMMYLVGILLAAWPCALSTKITEKEEVGGTGVGVAFSGSTLVVGNYGCSLPLLPCALAARLNASDGAAQDWFGYSLAYDHPSSALVVGAHYHDTNGNLDQGAAYVFDCSSSLSACAEAGKLTSSDGAPLDLFGFDLGISGTMIVVGANYHDTNGSLNQGAAYVFDCSSSLSTCVEASKLSSSDGIQGDEFGVSVAISGSVIVVGAWFSGANETELQGAAYVFDCPSPSLCTETGKLNASDGAMGDTFGRSVAISGSLIAIGALHHDDRGAVYLFDCSSSFSSCNQRSKLVASDGASGDEFSESLAISGRQILVGAPFHDPENRTDQGAAYLFDCSSPSSCVNVYKLEGSSGEAGDYFGTKVGFTGSSIAVSAPQHGPLGSVYLFDLSCVQGKVVPIGCSCVSGSGGASCDLDFLSGSGCSSLPSVSPLLTEPVGEFMVSESSIISDLFTMVVYSNARDGRYFSSLSLNEVPACSYPGDHFTKGFLPSPDCQDTFTASFTIPELVQNCSFSEVAGSNVLTLEGKLHVTSIDPMGSFRQRLVHRTTLSVLNLNIILPTLVALETGNLTVVSPIDSLLAVSRQEYDFGADQAVIEITSSSQWPYFLSSPALVQGAALAAETLLSVDNSQCPQDTPGSSCLQVTILEINNVRNGAGLCDFGGLYSFEWNYDCRSGLSSPCPVDGMDLLFSNLTLVSGDICGNVEVVSSLSGELKSYSDATFGTEKIAFVAGERIYLKATLSGDVSIRSVEVNEVAVVQQGSQRTLVQGGVTAAPFDGTLAFNGDEGVTSSEEVGFGFNALLGETEQHVFDAGGPSVFSFTVQVLLDVTYQTTFGRKRDLLKEPLPLQASLVLSH